MRRRFELEVALNGRKNDGGSGRRRLRVKTRPEEVSADYGAGGGRTPVTHIQSNMHELGAPANKVRRTARCEFFAVHDSGVNETVIHDIASDEEQASIVHVSSVSCNKPLSAGPSGGLEGPRFFDLS